MQRQLTARREGGGRPRAGADHGESGTGKELIAHAHQPPGNVHRPFVVVNSSALPEALSESELLRATPRLLTGAVEDRLDSWRSRIRGNPLP